MKLSKIGFSLFISALFGNIIVWAFIPAWGASGLAYPILLGAALLGLILWVVFSADRLKIWIKQRGTQFGLSLAVMALMTFFILGFVNWLAVWATTEKGWKKDMTASQLHTLGDQTVKILEGLSENVLVRVYSTNVARISSNLDVRKFLENYQSASKGKLKLEIKNPNEFSTEAQEDKIQRDNIIIVRALGSGRESRVENFSDNKGEEQLTNAIIQAIKGQKKTLCFISGHGQPSISDAGPQGVKVLKDALESSNYTVKETVLVSVEKIPEECELLANIGPRNSPLDREMKMIEDYILKGGSIVSLLGPRAPKEWKMVYEKYGIEFRKDLLVDPYRQQNPVVIETRNYARDVDVTESFSLATLFPETTSIRVPMQSKEGLLVKTFVSSETRSYAKAGDIKSLKDIRPSNSDIKGPIPIAVLIEKDLKTVAEKTPEKPTTDGPGDNQGSLNFDKFNLKKYFEIIPTAHAQDSHGSADLDSEVMGGMMDGDEMGAGQDPTSPKEVDKSRLIVFSNDLFVVNGVIKNAGNLDLFSNAVNYLLQDKDLMGIRPRDIRQTYLEITVQDIRKVWGFVLIVAGLFVVFGVKAARRKSISIA